MYHFGFWQISKTVCVCVCVFALFNFSNQDSWHLNCLSFLLFKFDSIIHEFNSVCLCNAVRDYFQFSFDERNKKNKFACLSRCSQNKKTTTESMIMIDFLCCSFRLFFSFFLSLLEWREKDRERIFLMKWNDDDDELDAILHYYYYPGNKNSKRKDWLQNNNIGCNGPYRKPEQNPLLVGLGISPRLVVCLFVCLFQFFSKFHFTLLLLL